MYFCAFVRISTHVSVCFSAYKQHTYCTGACARFCMCECNQLHTTCMCVRLYIYVCMVCVFANTQHLHGDNMIVKFAVLTYIHT